jgi:hypothetical protein
MFNIPTVTVAKTTLASAASSVTLEYAAPYGVSWTPRHLVLRVNAKSTTAAAVVGGRLQFNGDTGSNYNSQELYAVGTGTTASRNTDVTSYYMGGLDGNDSNEFGGGELLIPDALSTRTHKSLLNFTGANEAFVGFVSGRWASTAAVTSINYSASSGNLAAGSTFELCVVDESYNINEQILGSDGSFTVGSISAADGDLVVIGNLRDASSNYAQVSTYQLNGDSTATNYSVQKIEGAISSVQSTSENNNRFASISGNTAATSVYSPTVTQVTNFSDGSNDRVTTTLYGYHTGTSDTYNASVGARTSRWNNTAAITSYVLPLTYESGSMLSTYAVPKNLIERVELGAAANITFADIPQTYDHLELSVYARCDVDGDVKQYAVWFNGETTMSDFERQTMYAGNTTVAAFQHSSYVPGIIPGSTSTANVFGSQTIILQNYTLTDRHQSALILGGYTTRPEIQMSSGRWKNTAAITSIYLECEDSGGGGENKFEAGTIVELRGISSTIPLAAGYTIFF